MAICKELNNTCRKTPVFRTNPYEVIYDINISTIKSRG